MEPQPRISKLSPALTDDEMAAFRQSLAAIVGEEEATKQSWLRRAALAADGRWFIGINEPFVPSLGQHHAVPWNYPSGSAKGGPVSTLITFEAMPGMCSRTRFVPIGDAVASLRGPHNPELELERRRRLFDEAVRKDQQEAESRERAEQARIKAVEEYAKRRPERWAALPRAARAFYVAAADAPRTPAQALLFAAKLLSGGDSRLTAPPETFEPKDSRL